jgi:hypothetical protein
MGLEHIESPFSVRGRSLAVAGKHRLNRRQSISFETIVHLDERLPIWSGGTLVHQCRASFASHCIYFMNLVIRLECLASRR